MSEISWRLQRLYAKITKAHIQLETGFASANFRVANAENVGQIT